MRVYVYIFPYLKRGHSAEVRQFRNKTITLIVADKSMKLNFWKNFQNWWISSSFNQAVV